MRELIASIIVHGDDHLSASNRGAHRNYPLNSLERFQEVTNAAEELKATHIIGLGDFTYKKFHDLDFRIRVEAELTKRQQITNGKNLYLLGNHDTATSGMTEYQFYMKKGLLVKPENFSIGKLNFSFIPNGDYTDPQIITPSDATTDFVFAHDFFKFKNSDVANFGDAIELDNYEPLFGVDYLICGHIHSKCALEGYVMKNGEAKKMVVHYPGCSARPDFNEYIPTTGNIIHIQVFDNGEYDYSVYEYDLPPIDEIFNIDKKISEKRLEQAKRERVDISDEVRKLSLYNGIALNPEERIKALEVPEKYKLEALRLLKEAE